MHECHKFTGATFWEQDTHGIKQQTHERTSLRGAETVQHPKMTLRRSDVRESYKYTGATSWQYGIPGIAKHTHAEHETK